MKLHLRLAFPLLAVAVAVTLAGMAGSILLVQRTYRLALQEQERQVAGVVTGWLAIQSREVDATATVLAVLDGPVGTRLSAWKHGPVDSAALLEARTGRPLSTAGAALDRADFKGVAARLRERPLLLTDGRSLFLAGAKEDSHQPGLIALAATRMGARAAAALRDLLRNDVAIALEGKDLFSSSLPRDGAVESTPLSAAFATAGGRKAAIRVMVPLTRIHRERRRALGLVVAGGTILLAVALLFYNWALARVTRPLTELSSATGRIAAGDLGARLPADAPAELGQLIARFNGMASRLKETQDRLLHTAKLSIVGRLVAGISHELNNPLLALITHAELLGGHIAPGAAGREELDVILGESGRLKRILGELRDLVRPSTGEAARVELNPLARDVVNLVRHQAAKSGVAIEAEPDAGNPAARAVPDRVRQVLLNLALNALEAVPAGGTIRVRTSAGEDGTVRVVVEDNGPGISRENMARITEPFFSTKPGRMGLGLALSREIAERMGGTLAIESGEGKGTRATLSLPGAGA